MKLEQRLISLTRQLANARRDNDVETIERLEDEIDWVEIQLEEELDSRYAEEWD